MEYELCLDHEYLQLLTWQKKKGLGFPKGMYARVYVWIIHTHTQTNTHTHTHL